VIEVAKETEMVTERETEMVRELRGDRRRYLKEDGDIEYVESPYCNDTPPFGISNLHTSSTPILHSHGKFFRVFAKCIFCFLSGYLRFSPTSSKNKTVGAR
jgi:hypothetical protein